MQIMNNLSFSLLRMTFSSKFKTSTRGQETGEAGGRELALAPSMALGSPFVQRKPRVFISLCALHASQPGLQNILRLTSVVCVYHGAPGRVCGSRERLSGRLLCVTPRVRLHQHPDSAGPWSLYLSSSRGGDSLGEASCMSHSASSLILPFIHNQCWPHSVLVARYPLESNIERTSSLVWNEALALGYQQLRTQGWSFSS